MFDDSPFYENTEIKSAIIENGVTGIGSTTFYKCISLESVTIPDSVTSIGSEAFRYCTSLEKVTLLNNSLDIYALPASAVIWCYRDSVAHERWVASERRFILFDGTTSLGAMLGGMPLDDMKKKVVGLINNKTVLAKVLRLGIEIAKATAVTAAMSKTYNRKKILSWIKAYNNCYKH